MGGNSSKLGLSTNRPDKIDLPSHKKDEDALRFAKGFDDGFVRTVGSGGSTIKKIGVMTGIGETLYPLGAGLEGLAALTDRHTYEKPDPEGTEHNYQIPQQYQSGKQVGNNYLEKAKIIADPSKTLFNSWI